jgi:hypothetical protein
MSHLLLESALFMKNHLFALLLIGSTIGIVIFSCKKGDTGGDATVTAYVKHHNQPINFPTVYVKFDADELPPNPTSNYDLKVVGHHENHVHIEGLRYGKYFLYATGFDSTIMQPVSGGIPIKIKWSERKKEINVDIPVTE